MFSFMIIQLLSNSDILKSVCLSFLCTISDIGRIYRNITCSTIIRFIFLFQFDQCTTYLFCAYLETIYW